MSRNSRAYRMLCELHGKVLCRHRAGQHEVDAGPAARRNGCATMESLEPRLLLSAASGPVVNATVTVDEGQTAVNAGAFDDFDFNDLVEITASAGTVTGNSPVGFVDSGQSLAEGLQNQDTALGDLDGDGDLDAFVTNWLGAEHVLLNDGTGTYTDSGQLLGSSATYRVSLGDVDKDGDLDAVAASDSGAVVWLNDGAANFTVGQVLRGAADVALGDLDGDGYLDVYLAVRGKANEVWFNDGSGTFVYTGLNMGGTAQSYGVELADLDGDTDLDALVANLSAGQNTIYLNKLNTSNPTFEYYQFVGGKSPEAVAGDVDGDGDLDIFIPYIDRPNEVWRNDGGTFIDTGQRLGGVVDSRDVALVDLDYDGDLDAFVANRPIDSTMSSENTIWLNDGLGNYTDSGQSLGDGDSRDVEMGDVDGDGDLDAFVANSATDSKIWLYDSPWNWLLATTDGPDQSQTVAITATDSDGATATTTFDLVVNNVAPDFEAGPNETLPPGTGAFSRAGITFTDPGADAWSGTVTFGDGTGDQALTIDQTGRTFDLAHTYTAGGTYMVSVTIDDGDGGSHTDTFDVEVGQLVSVNTPPTVQVDNATVPVSEGDPAANAGTFDDVDPGDDVTITASAGTIVQDSGNSGTWGWAFDTTDGPDENQTVTITATDTSGETAEVTFDLVVNNVAPTVEGAAFAIVENSPNGTVVGTVTATDPGDDTLTYSITSEQTAFAVDANTGEITVADETQLDFETNPSLVLEIEVEDDEVATGTATVTIDLLNQASVTGAVFVDVNANGLYEANEPGIDGVAIELLDADGNAVLDELGNPVTTATSDGGFYLFEDLDPGTYRVHEIQPTGVDDGAEILGSLGGTIMADDTMQLALERVDASDYAFAEIGQQVTSGDTAGIGFWQNKHGQALIRQGGAGLANWLTMNFGNVFGNTFADGVGSDDGYEVAAFFKDQLFRQKGKKSAGPAKVDAQFMAVAFAAYFTSGNLAGGVAGDYGFNVTDTGIGTKTVNVGGNGAAFGVADNTDLTIMQLLLATNDLTDLPDDLSGFAHIYDRNGDGQIDASEALLRTMANEIYSTINQQGG